MILKNYFSMVKSTVVQPPLLARLAAASGLKADGKLSTRFPLGGIVEPTSPPKSSRDYIRMASCLKKKTQIFKKSWKSWKSLNLPKNPGPGHFTFIEWMNSRIAPWFSFSLKLMGKIQMIKTVENKLDNSKKKAPKTINTSTFFNFQLAGPCNRITLSSYRSRLY